MKNTTAYTLLVAVFILIILSNKASAQVNYCNYFRLNIEETSYNGKRSYAISPEIIERADSFYHFLVTYKGRFEYILFNRLDSLNKYGRLYPDTALIQYEFCNYLKNSDKFNYYLTVLTNSNKSKELYTVKELLKIASRFFMCDKVNKADTSVGWHICIGINGQKELQSAKDYTVLEAFCFEAIFHFLNTQGNASFKDNFKNYVYAVSKKYKAGLISFDDFLLKVKQDCYTLMENDDSLKKALLQYYQSNKESIGFSIR